MRLGSLSLFVFFNFPVIESEYVELRLEWLSCKTSVRFPRRSFSAFPIFHFHVHFHVHFHFHLPQMTP